MQSSARLPSLHTFRALIAVAKTRSFTKAGEELGLTQTAVSHQIAQLEAWFGARFFVRGRGGVELTAEAEAAIPRIEAALSDLQEVVEATRSRLRRQDLRISTTPEFASQWLQSRLSRFCAAHREIDVSVTIEYRRARFDTETVDVAIWLSGTLPQADAIRLTNDYEFVVCSPDVDRTLPQRQALAAAPLLRYEGARHTVLDWERWYGQIYERKGTRDDFDFASGPCYPTFSDMINACREGAGLALVRGILVADDLLTGRLIKCFTETVPSDLQYRLVVSPSRRRSSEVIAFCAWITDEIGKRVPET
jgi:LysR family glycine cleavage system transcriptional activator